MSEDMLDDRTEAYIEPREEPSVRLLRQWIVQNKSDAASGHRRHTEAIRILVERLVKVEGTVALHGESLTRHEEVLKRPVEATSIRFDAKVVLALLALCASIVGGQKWSASDLKEQIAAQANETKIVNVKMDAIKQHNDDATKLQDATNATMQRELTRIGGQATMIDTKLSNLMTGRR
jgi:hypothetical protein